MTSGELGLSRPWTAHAPARDVDKWTKPETTSAPWSQRGVGSQEKVPDKEANTWAVFNQKACWPCKKQLEGHPGPGLPESVNASSEFQDLGELRQKPRRGGLLLLGERLQG